MLAIIDNLINKGFIMTPLQILCIDKTGKEIFTTISQRWRKLNISKVKNNFCILSSLVL